MKFSRNFFNKIKTIHNIFLSVHYSNKTLDECEAKGPVKDSNRMIRIMITKTTITTLPLQLFLPSPVNPGLHVQL